MVVSRLATKTSPCSAALPELQGPMINTMVRCLEAEHRKMDEHILQLALAATRLARDPNEPSAKSRAVEGWDEIRRELWSHLQIEDELVFSWGDAHRAIAPAVLDGLKHDREEMRRLLAALPGLESGDAKNSESTLDWAGFAQTLTALAQNLDSHIERFDTEVLPAILRAVFCK
jgi:iron-sulfur cluster repair protein YtfE (RIC family)